MFVGSFVYRGEAVVYDGTAWDCDDAGVLRQVVQEAAAVAGTYSPALGSPQAHTFRNVAAVFAAAGATDVISSKPPQGTAPEGAEY